MPRRDFPVPEKRLFNKTETFRKTFENNGTVQCAYNKTTGKKEEFIMNKNDQEFLVQKIRTQYAEKENTQLDALKKLDAQVRRPANVFAYTFGSIGAIVMGSGMSLVMTDIGSAIGVENGMVPGIVVGVVGMLMAILNYPI